MSSDARRHAGWVAVAVLALLAEGGVRGARGQVAPADTAAPAAARFASPELPPEHWAVDAARRAEALGLLSSPLPARRTLSARVVAQALREAERSDVAGGLARGWTARLAEELPGVFALLGGAPAGVVPLGSRATLALRDRHDATGPGLAEFPPERTGALPLPDRTRLTAAGATSLAVGSRLGVLVEPELDVGGARLARAELALRAGRWILSVGRQPVGFGHGPVGGVVLSGAVPLDRAAVKTERTVLLPGFLAALGPVDAELFASRLSEARHQREPYLAGGAFTVRPHPRASLSVQRAAQFGGSGYPVTARRMLQMLIGQVAGLGFENQLVAVEARLRLPTERVVPLTAYLEWGAEDAAGGWRDVPGRVIGLETPRLPGAEPLALGVAYTAIAQHCCGNSGWYRHGAFAGGWASRDEPLGHPLGGEGRELMLYSVLDAWESRLRADSRLFWRERGIENLYVPGRESTTGYATALHWRLRSTADLSLSVSQEFGSGPTERRAQAGVNLYF